MYRKGISHNFTDGRRHIKLLKKLNEAEQLRWYCISLRI